MERARQLRRDLITVAVVVVLLGAAMLLISSSAASAQTATEDQYSSATSASASASATASANPTSDQYPNGSSSGGTASLTTPAPVDNTEDPSGTQATADALQNTLQAMALQIALQGIGLGHPPAIPGASTIGGHPWVPPAMPIGPVGIPTELLKCLLPQGCPGPSSPSSIPEIIDRSQLRGLFANPLEKLINPNPSDTDRYDDDRDGSLQDGPYDEAN